MPTSIRRTDGDPLWVPFNSEGPRHTTKSTAAASSVIAAPVILFGIDPSGKPKAARFASAHAALAIKAADQLHLRVVASTDPNVADLAGRVPVGRIHATGKTFLPLVARDLYDKLLAVAPNGGANDTEGASGSGAAGAPAGSGPTPAAETSKTPKATTAKQDKPTTDQRPSAAQPLAHDWQDINANHLVLAKHDGPRPAWWEAIAVETKDDRVKVRWRDFPAIPPVSRARFDLALLCADAGRRSFVRTQPASLAV